MINQDGNQGKINIMCSQLTFTHTTPRGSKLYRSSGKRAFVSGDMWTIPGYNNVEYYIFL